MDCNGLKMIGNKRRHLKYCPSRTIPRGERLPRTARCARMYGVNERVAAPRQFDGAFATRDRLGRGAGTPRHGHLLLGAGWVEELELLVTG